MIVIFVAVFTVAAAKEAKGKNLNFTANLELYFQICQLLSSLHSKYVSFNLQAGWAKNLAFPDPLIDSIPAR